MRTFYVETYRPPFPDTGVKVTVHRDRNYSADVLNPGMTSVFEVRGVRTKLEALAVMVEHAAGKPVMVRKVFG